LLAAGPANISHIEDYKSMYHIQKVKSVKFAYMLETKAKSWSNNNDNIEILISSDLLDDIKIDKIIKFDEILRYFSYFLLLAYLWFYTNSVFLAFVAVINIVITADICLNLFDFFNMI